MTFFKDKTCFEPLERVIFSLYVDKMTHLVMNVLPLEGREALVLVLILSYDVQRIQALHFFAQDEFDVTNSKPRKVIALGCNCKEKFYSDKRRIHASVTGFRRCYYGRFLYV